MTHRYHLDALSRLDLDQYPLRFAGLDCPEEVTRLQSVPPESIETLGARIRDLVWSAVVWDTKVQCRNCQARTLAALKGPEDAILLYCDFCGFAQDSDGTPTPVRQPLSPLTTEELRQSGLLVRSRS
jgi:hypothetical protein